MVAEIAGDEFAQSVQLGIEYDPQPPFAAGHPRTAEPVLVEQARALAAELQTERKAQVEKAAAALRD